MRLRGVCVHVYVYVRAHLESDCAFIEDTYRLVAPAAQAPAPPMLTPNESNIRQSHTNGVSQRAAPRTEVLTLDLTRTLILIRTLTRTPTNAPVQ